MTDGLGDRDISVLRSKRDASQYQILVAIAARQPAVSQQEIADAVGVTAQAVSDYIRELVESGHVEKHGRGRYEVTKEGVDWLISRTDDLRGYTEFVAEEVIGQVESETAIAVALAITGAAAGEDVGVTDFEGLLDYETGNVTVVVFPGVRDGGSRALDSERVAALAADHDLVAAAGTEALAAARSADVGPDVRFGTTVAVQEAAARGLSVLLLVTTRDLSAHTDYLREHNIGYELVDARE